MNLDFPTSPINNQTYSANGIVYRYNADLGAWIIDTYTSADTIINSFLQANLAYAQANSAFDAANNVAPQIAPTYEQANTARDHANASFVHANASFVHANAAFDAANNVAPQIAPTYEQANTARDHANSAFASSNAVNVYSDSTYVKLTAASQTITGNLSVVGFLSVSGNTIFLDATRLEIDDPLIYLAGNNYTSDIVDIGFIANYVNATGQNVHTGLYREHEDKEYYLFQGYDKEPINNHIGALSNNMTLAVLNADLKTSNLTLGGANAILTIGAAFDKANNALANTSNVSFNGNIVVPGVITTRALHSLNDPYYLVEPSGTSVLAYLNVDAPIGAVSGVDASVDTAYAWRDVVPNGTTVGYINYDSAANSMNFFTGRSSVSKMTIDSNGRILGGTSSSLGNARVQSIGDSVTAAYLAYASSTAQREAIRFVNGNGEVGSIGMIANTITLKTAGTNRMAIDDTGNVLIGRTNSTVGNEVKLDVNGKVNAAGILINGAAFSTAPRVLSLASNTSPFVWNSNTYDQICFTALGNALTINADSGSPVDGQKIIFRFKPSGAQTLTWTTGATKAFRALGITLPTSLVSAKTVYVGCIYNATDQRWDAVAVSVEP